MLDFEPDVVLYDSKFSFITFFKNFPTRHQIVETIPRLNSTIRVDGARGYLVTAALVVQSSRDC